MVSRLAAVRGIATFTGLGLAVEISDWDRFTGASIGAYLGLVPTESSSGIIRAQGLITKTDNTHARPAGCWSRPPGTTNVPCGPPARPWSRAGPGCPAVRARAEAADRRLHHRWVNLAARKKRPTIFAVAVARELAGWCWSLATMND